MPPTQTQSVLRQAQDGEQSRTINEKLLSLPLGKNVKDFLDYLTVEAGLAKNTVLAYGRDLIGFLRHCKSSKISQSAADKAGAYPRVSADPIPKQ